MKITSFKIPMITCVPLLLTLIVSCDVANSDTGDKTPSVRLTYEANAAQGRQTFIDKNCVVCHSINNVGGKAATPLDASIQLDEIDIAEFSARIWRGAPAMVELQSLELGYVIELGGEDIVHIAAFLADINEQKKLLLEDIPENIQDRFLDQAYWDFEDWDEFLKQGQEGYGEPVEDDGKIPN